MFDHSELLKQIDPLVGGVKSRLLSCILGAAASLLALFLATQSGRLVALLTRSNEISATRPLIFCMLLAALLCAAAVWNAKRLCHDAESEAAHALRRSFFERALYSDSTPPAQETDIESTTKILSLHLCFTSCALLAAGALILMLNISVGAAVAVMLSIPLLLFISHRITRHTELFEFRRQKAHEEFSALNLRSISQGTSILACRQENYILTRFDALSKHAQNTAVQAGALQALRITFTGFAEILLCIVAVCIGALSVLTDYISAVDLFTLLLLSLLFSVALKQLYAAAIGLKHAAACAEHTFAVLDPSDESPDAEDGYDLIRTDGHVLFQEVALHDKERPSLDHADFEIASGSRVGIIDPNGDLCEVLFPLLLRQWDADEGVIRISGKDVRHITKRSLCRCCMLLDENVWIKTGTIAENIALSRPNAERREIIAAAKSAQAHGFICRMPLGYDTPVGNGGFPLSESEKQLICIARFLLSSGSMLLWNNAASAADARTEFKLQDLLSRIMSGHTCFIATSRIRALEDADTILSMSENKIIAERRSSCPLYARER